MTEQPLQKRKEGIDPTPIVISVIISLLAVLYLFPQYNDTQLRNEIEAKFILANNDIASLESSKANLTQFNDNFTCINSNITNFSSRQTFFEGKLTDFLARLLVQEQNSTYALNSISAINSKLANHDPNLSAILLSEANLSANITSLRDGLNSLTANSSQTFNWSTYFDMMLNDLNTTLQLLNNSNYASLNNSINLLNAQVSMISANLSVIGYRLGIIEQKLCILNSSWC